MNTLTRFFLLFCLSFAVLPFFSCTARINGPLNPDGSADISINASLEPRTAALIRNLSAAAGAPAGALILDGPAIARSMSEAPGVSSVSFENTGPAAIDGNARISRIGEFLASSRSNFISFEQGPAGGHCQISINRETSPEILALLSPEVAVYLAALMAPIATGEALDRAEYLFLVSTVYSRAIADEISGSRIRASVTFPGNISSVKGGTYTGRRADFDIPLLDLLVLETPLSYEVNWR